MANSFEKDARNLAEATLRLAYEMRSILRVVPSMNISTVQDACYALDDAEGEAKNILAKTTKA